MQKEPSCLAIHTGNSSARGGGEVTPDDIFANTWMKKAVCEGKPTSDPEVLRALKEYVVSRHEEEVLTRTMEDREYSRERPFLWIRWREWWIRH